MIYLLHFNEPISPKHTAQHYIGFADDVDRRLKEHQIGQGARLTQVAIERGISWQLARVWEGDRTRERQIKKWHNGPKLCPICQEEKE